MEREGERETGNPTRQRLREPGRQGEANSRLELVKSKLGDLCARGRQPKTSTTHGWGESRGESDKGSPGNSSRGGGELGRSSHQRFSERNAPLSGSLAGGQRLMCQPDGVPAPRI